MAVDVSKFSHQQLRDLIQHAESRQRELAKEKVVKTRDKVLAILKSEGVTLEQVFSGALAGRRTRRPADRKYRNPSDHSQTWSGRGKRPRWFEAALKSGKKEKDLLI